MCLQVLKGGWVVNVLLLALIKPLKTHYIFFSIKLSFHGGGCGSGGQARCPLILGLAFWSLAIGRHWLVLVCGGECEWVNEKYILKGYKSMAYSQFKKL